MPDLTNYPAVDVAIGLVVMFFLLSIVCSAIQEFFASVTKMRARYLEKGLREILGETAANSVQERLPGERQSYIDSRQFSLAILDTVLPEEASVSPLAKARVSAEKIQAEALKGPIVRLLKGTEDDIATARADLEAWFDASMDRVSG